MDDSRSRGRTSWKAKKPMPPLERARIHFMLILEDDFCNRIDNPLDENLRALNERVTALHLHHHSEKDFHRLLLAEMIPFYESLVAVAGDSESSGDRSVGECLQLYLTALRDYRGLLSHRKCILM